MKNITEQKPSDPLSGRTYWVSQFISGKDIEKKKILDIGCGYGWFELLVLQRKAISILGTELAEEDLATAKKYITDKRVTLAVGSAINLPCKKSAFDTVVSWEVIEHIPPGTEEKMFSEISRVLKKGGVLYLSTPHRSLISTVLDPAWWLIGHRHYHTGDLVDIAKKTGFIVERVEIRGGWTEVFWLLNLYISKWIFHRSPVWERWFEKHLTQEYSTGKGFTNIFLKCVKKK